MPAADTRRDIIVSFRVSPLEAAHLDSAGQALKAGARQRADFCRAAALHAAKGRVPEPSKPVLRPGRRLPALDTQLLSKLLAAAVKIGGHTNQLAKHANTTGGQPRIEVLTQIAVDIAELRTALTTALRGGDRTEMASGDLVIFARHL